MIRCPHQIRSSRSSISPCLLLILSLTATPQLSAANVVLTDPAISGHVNHELVFDPAVSMNDIDVSTQAGIVTLTGTVDNLLAKERATRIAETVRGVRSVINRIEVRPKIQRTAPELEKAVQEALLYDNATESYEISVQARDSGRITLNGTVDSWQERELAERVVKGVSGVTAVDNRIKVEMTSVRLDAEIRPEIEQRMRWDTLVDDALIDVAVNSGHVVLTGTVGSAAEQRRAEWNAWVGGVKSVDASALKVEKWARDEALRATKYGQHSDLEIREAVLDSFDFDPRLTDVALKAKVTNGVVTLHGLVDDQATRQAAERNALNTVGVQRVDNRIKLLPLPDRDTATLRDKVSTALLRNPFTESQKIEVQADGHAVTLTGTVDSYFQKAEAENVAYQAKGVTDVRNELKVEHPTTLIYNPYVYGWSIYDYPWYVGDTRRTGMDDREIHAKIRDELRWSPFVDAEDVQVEVEDGVAILSGTVASTRERDAAEQNAYEAGAVTVDNNLHIEVDNRLLIGTTR